MVSNDQFARVCGCCGNVCEPKIGQFIYSKEKAPDGSISITKMDDVVVSECCGASYEIYFDDHEVGTGSEGIDKLTPVEEFFE